MEAKGREYLLSGSDRGVVFGLIVRKPASGLTVTVEGGVIRVGAPTTSPPARSIEKTFAQTTQAITASKDAYLYITEAGALAKLEVANGAAKPSQADIGTNSEFIAKCVSNGTDVTGVVDLRRDAPHGEIKMLEVDASFVTATQGGNGTVVPWNGRLIAVEAIVTAALAGTDAGTITPAIGENDVFTNVTGGVVTIPLSSAVDTRVRAIPTALRSIRSGNLLRLTSAKTTSGGAARVLAYIELER